jgi:cytoskeleton protein RodZ
MILENLLAAWQRAVTMASFGENLRREREMRGVTLEEISATTKISVRLLRALEAEDFAKLPGGIFTRSFIRAYAGFLGLDPERILAEFHLAAPAQGEADLSRVGTSKAKKSQQSSGRTILTFALAIVLMGAGYTLFRYSHRTPEIFQLNPSAPANPSAANPAPASPSTSTAASPISSADTSATAPPTNVPASEAATSEPAAEQGGGKQTLLGAEKAQPEPLSQVSTPTSASQGAGISPSSSAEATASNEQKPLAAQPGFPAQPATGRLAVTETNPPVIGEGDLLLQLAATERAWVAVEADGKTILQRILNPNEVRTLRAKDSFKVMTGNAQGIILTLNGETLKPLGRRGEVKTVNLTRNDLKNPMP